MGEEKIETRDKEEEDAELLRSQVRARSVLVQFAEAMVWGDDEDGEARLL